MAKYSETSKGKKTPGRATSYERRIATYTEFVLKRKEAARHLRGLGTGLTGLKREGVTSTGASIKAPMKEQAVELLAACGIDTTLPSLDKVLHKKDFSLMTIQTSKEKMKKIMDPTYKTLTDELKRLDVKQISLSDAIRELDDPRPDSLRIQTEQIKKDQTSDFKMMAAKMVRSSRDDSSKKTLKYFKTYSVDSAARLAKLPFAQKVTDSMTDKRFGEQ